MFVLDNFKHKNMLCVGFVRDRIWSEELVEAFYRHGDSGIGGCL